MAIPIIVSPLPADVRISVPVSPPGVPGGGSLAVARFTTGPDRPPTPNAGRKIRS